MSFNVRLLKLHGNWVTKLSHKSKAKYKVSLVSLKHLVALKTLLANHQLGTTDHTIVISLCLTSLTFERVPFLKFPDACTNSRMNYEEVSSELSRYRRIKVAIYILDGGGELAMKAKHVHVKDANCYFL